MPLIPVRVPTALSPYPLWLVAVPVPRAVTGEQVVPSRKEHSSPGSALRHGRLQAMTGRAHAWTGASVAQLFSPFRADILHSRWRSRCFPAHGSLSMAMWGTAVEGRLWSGCSEEVVLTPRVVWQQRRRRACVQTEPPPALSSELGQSGWQQHSPALSSALRQCWWQLLLVPMLHYKDDDYWGRLELKTFSLYRWNFNLHISSQGKKKDTNLQLPRQMWQTGTQPVISSKKPETSTLFSPALEPGWARSPCPGCNRLLCLTCAHQVFQLRFWNPLCSLIVELPEEHQVR